MKLGLHFVAAALAVSCCVTDTAEAGRRYGSSGSSGGSFSSHGSSGSSGSEGSSGSHGSSGSSGFHGSSGSSGSRGSHGLFRLRGHHGSSGSSGFHGSSGSSGSYGGDTYGSGGSSGSSGSSGGSYNSYGSGGSSGSAVYQSNYEVSSYTPLPVAVVEQESKAQLVFHVPADATIYLMGQKMTSTGTTRTFKSPTLRAGKKFGYPIRVELTRDGQTFEAAATQVVRAGDRVQLNVGFDEKSSQVVLAQVKGQKGVLGLVQAGQSAGKLVSQK